MNNFVTTFDWIFFIIAGKKETHKIYHMVSKFGRIRPGTYELPALERLKNPHRLIMGEVLGPL